MRGAWVWPCPAPLSPSPGVKPTFLSTFTRSGVGIRFPENPPFARWCGARGRGRARRACRRRTTAALHKGAPLCVRSPGLTRSRGCGPGLPVASRTLPLPPPSALIGPRARARRGPRSRPAAASHNAVRYVVPPSVFALSGYAVTSRAAVRPCQSAHGSLPVPAAWPERPLPPPDAPVPSPPTRPALLSLAAIPRPPTPCRRSTLSPIRKLYTDLAPIGRLLKNGKASVAVPCGVRGGRGRRPCRPRTHCLPVEVAAFALRRACVRTPRRTVALPPNPWQGGSAPCTPAGASRTPRTPRGWRLSERTFVGVRQRSVPVKRKSRHNSAALRPCGHLFRFSA